MTGILPPPLERERQDPPWTWLDAGLLLGLMLPCALIGLGLNALLLWLLPAKQPDALRAIGAQFLAYGLWFGALFLLLKARYDAPFWDSLGWRVPWPRMRLTIFIGPALVILVVIVGTLLHTPEIDNAVQKLLKDKTSILLVGFFATTLGPLAEELIFRGFLQPLTVRTFGAWAGVALASLPFALLHGPQYSWSWQHVLMLFLASSVFGIVRWKLDSTAASTLVHATYNLAFFTGFLLQRKDLLN
ncbi:MAG: CPBP family intramembrane metalloprotease [Acidobacteria bacterium]|nr:CPBP family intramembrane metalloprotease [Acidobacteriota bacterium]